METVRTMQNPTGGFGGGFGQLSHVAPTYAIILALGIVGCAGGASDDVLRETMGIVDRRSMWEWLGRLKSPDGGFRVCEGGEEDARYAQFRYALDFISTNTYLYFSSLSHDIY